MEASDLTMTTPGERQTEASKTGDTSTSSGTLKCVKRCLTRHIYLIVLVLSLFLGFGLGIALLILLKKPLSARELRYLEFPGKILIHMLNVLILPLVVSSIISGLTIIDVWAVGKMGLRTVAYFVVVNCLASAMGIIVAITLLPYRALKKAHGQLETLNVRRLGIADTVFDLIRQMFPSNMVEATFRKTQTVLLPKKTIGALPRISTAVLGGNTTNTTTGEMMPVLTTERDINMLGVIVMSVVAGIIINKLEDRALPLKVFFDCVYDITLFVIHVIEWYMPVGVLFLVMKDVASLTQTHDMLYQMTYVISVTVALLVHGLVTLPGIYFLVCRKNPYQHLRRQLEVIVTAFSTASSLATLPVNMKNLKKKENRIDPRVVDFVAPVGSCVNKDGTAVYQAVAVIYIGIFEGFRWKFTNILVIWLMSMIAATVTPTVPQGGLITLVINMQSVGITSDKLSLIMLLDWLLDRFRTCINVLSDSYGCAVVDRLSRDDLKKMDLESASSFTDS